MPGYSAAGSADGALRAVDDGCQREDFAARAGRGGVHRLRHLLPLSQGAQRPPRRASALIAQTSASRRGVAFATLAVPNIGLPVVLMSERVPARDGDLVQLTVNAAARGSTENVIAEIGPRTAR